MSCVRNIISEQGFSEESIDIIMCSWREGTKKSYKHYIQRWIQFCSQRERCSLEPNVVDLISFLTVLFQEGKNFNTLCVARSAISALSVTSNVSIGSHPLVLRFLSGAFNLKPSLPRNNVTWDPHLVLDLLKSWSPVKNLSLVQLSIKVVLLCLLVSGQRGQTIHLFNLKNMSWGRDRVTCRFGDLLKTSTPKHQDELVFKHFVDKRLCVVHYLNAYKIRTAALRGQESNFFISVRKPHSKVSRDTIRRWTKQGLLQAGIDMNIFTPHSTRAASSSKAAKAVGLRTILKTVGWRSASTFTTFYKKKIEGGNRYAEAVMS